MALPPPAEMDSRFGKYVDRLTQIRDPAKIRMVPE